MKKYFLSIVLMLGVIGLVHAQAQPQAKKNNRNFNPKQMVDMVVGNKDVIIDDGGRNGDVPKVCVTNNPAVNQIEIDAQSHLALGCSYNDDLHIICAVRVEARDKVVNYAGLNVGDAVALYQVIKQNRDEGGFSLNLCRGPVPNVPVPNLNLIDIND